jgi:hypothetical protein
MTVAGEWDLVQRTRDGRTFSYSVAGRSRGQVAPCAVCTWHVETRSVSFLVEPQNQGRWFLGLGLKTGSSGLVIWVSKSPRQFLGLSLKTKWASVCRLRHKTDGGRSARDTRRDLAACLASKQVWLGFFSLTWRLAEARRRVVHVAPSRRLCRRQAEARRVDATGCVRPCYHCFIVFLLLDPRGIVAILVFYLRLYMRL